MMDDLDDLILKIIIRSTKPLTAKEIIDAYKKEVERDLPRRTVNYHLVKLVSLKTLKPILNDRKQVAYMPMHRFKEWTDTRFEERKIHTDELKREVIEPWIEQLPIFHDTGIRVPSPLIIDTPYTGDEKLEVERHDLFGDLERHLEPRIFEEWELFKDKVREYTALWDGLLSEITGRLERATGLIASDKWVNGVLYDRRLSVRILMAIMCLYECGAEVFKSECLNFTSRIRRDSGSLIYSIVDDCIRVREEEEGEEGFRKRIDGVVSTLMKEGGDLLNSKDIMKLIELKKEIRNRRDLIDMKLVKYLRKPIFGGDCEYLK
jgi:hypothetical protein